MGLLRRFARLALLADTSGHKGGGALSLHAGKLLARQVAGHATENALPSVNAPLLRYPLHSLIRIPQRLMYRWYKHLDNSD